VPTSRSRKRAQRWPSSVRQRSTKLFEEGIAEGRLQNLGLPGALPIEGGVPLIEDGRIVGAIGVSGAQPEQDGACVKAAIDALS